MKDCPATQWLTDSPSQTLQQSLKDLERAYSNFFAKRAAFPRFKKKGKGDSFRYPQGCKLDQANDRIFLPKLGWLRYRNSREVLGAIKNVTVSLHAGLPCRKGCSPASNSATCAASPGRAG
ncbi:transposase [Aquaspirillum sp. LM1]|uniref:transposase n=1 Tax=Aquaspirillum sp. LM1 TaxID=1938604 RepID=UPI0012376C5E|nr:transposase [Aquaspirillum sp. LM1]